MPVLLCTQRVQHVYCEQKEHGVLKIGILGYPKSKFEHLLVLNLWFWESRILRCLRNPHMYIHVLLFERLTLSYMYVQQFMIIHTPFNHLRRPFSVQKSYNNHSSGKDDDQRCDLAVSCFQIVGSSETCEDKRITLKSSGSSHHFPIIWTSILSVSPLFWQTHMLT